MARPQHRLSLYPAAVPGESVSHVQEQSTVQGGPQNFTAQKSQVLQRLAETLVELDKTETVHFDALFAEEQAARQRYVQQFQSIAGKVQQLSDELEVDRGFRQEYQSAIARYTQEQSQEIDAFAQDMIQLRDLEHMVRGHLPVQLEALAALAGDIQIELRQKADMNASKSRLTQINQRLARLEDEIDKKADRAALDAQQERMTAVIPDRNRLARAFEAIGPAIREASARPASQIPVKGPGSTANAKSKAKAKGSGSLEAPLADGESEGMERKPSKQTLPEGHDSQHLSTPESAGHGPHGFEKKGSKQASKHGHAAAAKSASPPPPASEAKASAPAEAKASAAKASSKH